jgi:arginine exporter protein ArgO
MVMLVQTILLLAVGVFGFQVTVERNYFLFWLILTMGAICFLSLGSFWPAS